jgi:hypothetical protein
MRSDKLKIEKSQKWAPTKLRDSYIEGAPRGALRDWRLLLSSFKYLKNDFKMLRRLFIQQERNLAAELSAKFRGIASVIIATLEFPFEKLREGSEKNTERLQRLFKKQKSCRD